MTASFEFEHSESPVWFVTDMATGTCMAARDLKAKTGMVEFTEADSGIQVILQNCSLYIWKVDAECEQPLADFTESSRGIVFRTATDAALGVYRDKLTPNDAIIESVWPCKTLQCAFELCFVDQLAALRANKAVLTAGEYAAHYAAREKESQLKENRDAVRNQETKNSEATDETKGRKT